MQREAPPTAGDTKVDYAEPSLTQFISGPCYSPLRVTLSGLLVRPERLYHPQEVALSLLVCMWVERSYTVLG